MDFEISKSNSRIEKLRELIGKLDASNSDDLVKIASIEQVLGQIDYNQTPTSDSFSEIPHFAYYESDRFTRILRCSDEVSRILGYDTGEIKNQPSLNFVCRAERKTVADQYMNWIEEKRNDMTMMFRVVTKSGVEILVEQQSHFDFDDDGKFKKAFHFVKNLTSYELISRKIEDAEIKSRAMADATSEAIFISEKGVCIGQNEAARTMFGYSDEEAIGRHGTEWVSRQDRENVLRNLLNGNESPYFAMSMRKDGTLFPSEIRAKMFEFNEKKLRITAIKDLSKSFFAEKKLEENEVKYKTIIDFTLDIIFILDMKGRIVFLNDSIIKVLGYRKEEAVGQPFYKFVPKSEYPKYFKNLVRIYTRKSVINNFITKALHSNGNMVDVEINGRLISLDGITYALGTMRDITERMNTEKKIGELEKSYMELFNSINDSIFILSREGKFLDVNNGALRTYKYSKEDIIGNTPVMLGTGDNDFSKIGDLLEKAYSGKRMSFEFNAKRKNGEVFLKEVDLYPGYYAGNKVIIAVGRDITERRKAESILRESESKHRELYNLFRRMADNMPDMLWAKDMDMKYVFANKSLCNNLLNADNVDEPVGKTDKYFFERQIEMGISSSNINNYGEMCQISDKLTWEANRSMSFDELAEVKGRKLYLKVNKAPIYNDHGKVIGIVGSARDVTKSKQAESIQKLQYLIAEKISNSNDTHEVLEFVEHSLMSFTGSSSAILYRYNPDIKSFESLVSNTTIVISQTKRSEFLLEYDVVESQKPLLKKRHEILSEGWVEKSKINNLKCWLGVPFRLSHNSRGIIVLKSESNEDAYDSTTIMLLEIIGNQISNFIIKQEDQDQLHLLGKAVEQSQAGICIFDSNGNITFSNPGFDRIFKYEKSEIMGQNHRFFWLHDYHEGYYQKIKNILETGGDWNGELKAKDKLGNQIWLSVMIGPVKLGVSNQKSFVAILEDITENKRNLLALVEAKNLAERSDSLKTSFLQNMSHEIRTPLNGIIGFANLIDKEISDPNDFEDYAKIIRNSGNRLMELINNILDLSKIESGNVELKLSNFDLVKTFTDVHTILKIKAENKGLELNMNFNPVVGKYFIKSDEAKIHQVLINLVNNAIKFTETGKIDFHFEIGDEKVILVVEDTGIGISEEDIPSLFSRFYRINNMKMQNAEGSGLGLAITRGLVNLLGGKIKLESKVGVGSKFNVEIPVESAEPIIEIINEPKFRDLNQKMTILIAEDDEISKDLIKTILGTADYEYITVSNGEIAFEECVKNSRINLVFMDIKMPILDGIEATKKIKRIRPNLPIIIQTAFAFSNDKDMALRAGCDRYISKPISKNDLLKIVGELL